MLVGCQQNTNKSLNPNNISMITISIFKGFAQISDELILAITDKQEIDKIVEMVENAKPMEGILDVAAMHYDIKVTYGDKSIKGYHVYLGEENGTILDVENTGQGYMISKKYLEIFQEIIGHQD